MTADPKNIQTKYIYNVMGQLFQKIEESGTGGLARATSYYYDRLGNMTSIVANDGTSNQATGYHYDLLGRVDYIDYPDDTYIDYKYYASGKVENRKQGDSGSFVTTHYIYDEMGNLWYKQNHPTAPTIVESYEYDARGLMLTAKKGISADDGSISSVEMTYNGLGYMETSKQKIGTGASKEVQYDRDQLGQMKQLTIPTSTPVDLHYTYTSLGQIDKIFLIDEQTPIVDYSYKGTFVTGRSYATPSVVNFTPDYDDFGRLTQSTTVNGSNEGVDFEYPNYDNNGNIMSQKYHHRNQLNPPTNGFEYDALKINKGVRYIMCLTRKGIRVV